MPDAGGRERQLVRHRSERDQSVDDDPRKTWYSNLEEVTTNGEYEVTFRLKRPQPSFLALLASGWSPVYRCHVSPRDMRSHPIGMGPFKFVEFRPNERIRVAKNPSWALSTISAVRRENNPLKAHPLC